MKQEKGSIKVKAFGAVFYYNEQTSTLWTHDFLICIYIKSCIFIYCILLGRVLNIYEHE